MKSVAVPKGFKWPKDFDFFNNHLCRYFFRERQQQIHLLSPVCKAILFVLISFSIPYLSAPWLCQVLADFPSACVSREAKGVGVGVKGINSSGHIGSGFTPRNITAGTQKTHWSHGGSDNCPFFSWVICRFHVNLPGYKYSLWRVGWPSPRSMCYEAKKIQ